MNIMSVEPPRRVAAILVPLDGTKFSAIALPVATALAGRLGAEIHLLSAVAAVDEAAEREAELAAIELPGRHVHRTAVVDLDPAGAIHEALRRLDDAVVCMASHGRGRSAALVGSVATDVVARGHDPLIVVGPFIAEELKGAGVLACVDETPGSATLVPIALRWARLLGERLTIITVAEPVPPPVREHPVHRRFGPRGDVEGYLETLAAPLRAKGHDVGTLVIWDPISPGAGMRSHLEQYAVSLVVVGSHARRGLARFAFGSVAASVVHHSPSPVLVAPRPDLR
jgi:nucleotide-binding universal stress UspA family protein